MYQSSSSSSSSSSRKRKIGPDSDKPKYDVFLNYSSQDIGHSFISHLKGALDRTGFAIFDDIVVTPGQGKRSEVSKAIQESEIYVPVFSTGYASSVSCLDELLDIKDCLRRFNNRKVLPVFYNVEPSDVRKQLEFFKQAFESHETPDVDPEKVQKWKQALEEAGDLSGLNLENGDEAEFVLKIVEELEKMQSSQELLHVADHAVGIRSRVKELILKLRLDCEDVLVVAVHGISGIGKTTIVKATYNRIAAKFDGHCFIADIHSRFGRLNWKVELQNELISCLTQNHKHPIMNSHNDGVTKIRRLMIRRKILLVLDDVDNFQQLEALGIDPEWLYKGSRIIVTTRDKQSLGYISFTSYQTRLLNRRESLNLFTRILFSRDDPVNTKLIKEIVGHAGGLPLVIKVWGCHFRQFKRERWSSILKKLKAIPHGDVQKQLQISYDSLDKRAKRLFLDIVFFFLGWYKCNVVKVLEDEDSGFFPDIEIQYLVNKSLVEMSDEGHLRMHDAIREMGEEIVRQENEEEPERRTRLRDARQGWAEREVPHLLRDCWGNESVETIYFEGNFESVVVQVEALRKMRNLRLIRLANLKVTWMNSSHNETSPLFFKLLKYMKLDNLPFKSLDSIDMRNVVELHLQWSKLEILWEGMKSLKKLRVLDVSHSCSLTKTGDFYGLENLEELDLSHCKNLKELDGSICCLHRLVTLDISGCNLLMKGIPNCERIGKLPCLRQLTLGRCSFVLEPGQVSDTFLWLQESLLQLRPSKETELPNLPQNITSINIIYWQSLVNLPSNLSELKSLTVLRLEDCPQLGSEDPQFLMKVTGLTNLSHLTMLRCSVSQVPTEIGNLVRLKTLVLSGNPFSSLPDSLSNLLLLDYLNIEDCSQVRLLPRLPSSNMEINASKCWSLDVMSFDLSYIFCNKEYSSLSKQLLIRLPWEKVVPNWFSCRLEGGVLSLLAPDKKICGMMLCAHSTITESETLECWSSLNFKLLNKTKNTSHCLNEEYIKLGSVEMCLIFYPLDHTTLVVEPADNLLLQLSPKIWNNWSCGFRLIYESDVVDSKLLLQNVIRHTPTVPLEITTLIRRSNHIFNDSGDDSNDGDDDYGSDDDTHDA